MTTIINPAKITSSKLLTLLKYMYVHRQLEERIAPFLKRKEALSIIGPRQSGKTTFLRFLEEKLRNAGQKIKFITFETRADLDIFQNDQEDFKALVTDYDTVIIDEFQYAQNGGQKLKYLCDTSKTKFIVSGSSSLELSFQFGKYMVGRVLNFYLPPFSFREYLSFTDKEMYHLLERKIPSSRPFFDFNVKNGFGAAVNKRLTGWLEKYAVYGGYPAVVLSTNEMEKQKVLEGIADNYLTKDIKSLLRLATDNELLKLAKFLAAQIGGMVKYDELSAAAGLSYKEVLKHLNILEKTFIIALVRPFFTNKRIELTKNPKGYFVDLGIRNFLVSDFRLMSSRNDQGGLMENYAYNLLSNLAVSPEIKYWRTKSKAEVDFVIERQQDRYPVEIKYTSKDIVGKSLHSFIEKFRPKAAIILNKDYLAEVKIKQTKVKFIPLSYF